MANVNMRAPRLSESRETQSRAYVYEPPSTLPTPIESPDWVYRWLSESVVGLPDPNLQKRMEDQWSIVPYEEKDRVLSNPGAVLSLEKNATGKITIGSLVLARMPRERAEAREAYYAAMTRAQVTGVKEKNSAQFESEHTKLEQDIQSRTTHARPTQFG